MKVFKGKIKFGNKEYDCEVRDGIRYIDGKTVDEFLKTLDSGYLRILANKGLRTINKKKGLNYESRL